MFPNSIEDIDKSGWFFGTTFYEMSSYLTVTMVKKAKEMNYDVKDGAKGFAFNADAVGLIEFLDIRTQHLLDIAEE